MRQFYLLIPESNWEREPNKDTRPSREQSTASLTAWWSPLNMSKQQSNESWMQTIPCIGISQWSFLFLPHPSNESVGTSPPNVRVGLYCCNLRKIQHKICTSVQQQIKETAGKTIFSPASSTVQHVLPGLCLGNSPVQTAIWMRRTWRASCSRGRGPGIKGREWRQTKRTGGAWRSWEAGSCFRLHRR